MINLDAFHLQLFLLLVICTMAVQRLEETAGKRHRSFYRWLTLVNSEKLPVHGVKGDVVLAQGNLFFLFLSFNKLTSFCTIISFWTE